MAKKAKPVQSPRLLAMFHHGKGKLENRHFHCLAWFDHAGNTTQITGLHLLYNEDGRVVYEHRGPEEVLYLEGAAGVRSTAAEFERHLRKKLMENGGNAGAYEHLGVERPSVAPVVSADKKEDHDELYARAARVLKVPEAELRVKYGKLNPGLQAMNLRNRLRKAGKAV